MTQQKLSNPHQIDLNIQGMSCAACVGRVERVLKKLTVLLKQQLI